MAQPALHRARRCLILCTAAMRRSRQRGVAIVTALLLTTLALSVVASLFWQQQVQMRSIENQRLQLQLQWTLRSMLDWARLVLREDAKFSRTDTLDEPWAVPLTATRLDQYAEEELADNKASNADLAGIIIDAQSRYNLANLAVDGVINLKEVTVFARLLGNLQLNPALAQTTATTMAAAQQKRAVGTAMDGNGARMPLLHVDDLLGVPGYTPAILPKLREFLIVLPRPTPVNANTASAEVLAARMDTLSVSDADVLLAARNTASFRDLADIANRLHGRTAKLVASEVSVASSYFLVSGSMSMDRARLEIQALVERNGGNTKLIWTRYID